MKHITVKVGSSFFIDNNGKINREKMRCLISEIKAMKLAGADVCLVSSGAIAVGVKKMKLKSKPHDTAKKQALAAIGQMTLMQEYELIFDEFDLKCAQILVSHDDFGSRERVNCLRTTLETLFEYGVVPVVNENDAVAVEEIKVGDNDTLSAMTSLLIDSDLLILVSDVDGLYTANPNEDKTAKLINTVDKIDENIIALAKAPSSEFGTGGMQTKIKAAQISTAAGIPMLIMNATKIDSLCKIAFEKNEGTLFNANAEPLPLKKCWIRYCADVCGIITIDEGAKNALLERKSLLSVGVISASGKFDSGRVVEVRANDNTLIAKGVVSHDLSTIKKFLKEDKTSSHIVIHANNLVLSEDNYD